MGAEVTTKLIIWPGMHDTSTSTHETTGTDRLKINQATPKCLLAWGANQKFEHIDTYKHENKSQQNETNTTVKGPELASPLGFAPLLSSISCPAPATSPSEKRAITYKGEGL